MPCDLHTHSIFSDGTASPEGIVSLAAKQKLYAVALTDHNTVRGLERFAAAAKNKAVHAVGGCEISCGYQGKELHILALFVDADRRNDVMAFTELFRKHKEETNRLLCRELTKLGYAADYDEIKKQHTGYVNRAHIAKYLTDCGYAKDIAEVFGLIFKKDGITYRPKALPDAFETLDFINSIGAVSVLAHPFLSFKDSQNLFDFLKAAKDLRLDAMETNYSLYSPETEAQAEKIAEHFSLLKSGGSDYHADVKPNIRLGTGLGGLYVPNEYYDRLAERKNCK